ncbi:uncharacterized protein LOC111357058 [Spodoptera litura]|uniref:Uncharacterized protein LOC111357058 n=1 Tax=Spodoptera litura TaxID=69820 RepID=A0A9J7EAD3_SPOLT|nr:uncharacterized protein LOC111357058 [Spodoptera litura]
MTYDFNDVEDPQPVVKESDCFPNKVICDKNLNRQDYEPVCAYNTKYGLINYFSLCEINVQICLLELQKNDVNKRRQYNYGELYYNGMSHSCDYYYSHTTTGKEAIELYYKIGMQYNSD